METSTKNVGGNGNLLARERLEESFDSMRERMSELGGQVVSFVRERPGTALVLALGAGYLFGRLLRR